jgi:hypothetical protein
MLSLTFIGSILLGCSSYYTPIGSKSVDVKSYIFENDKLTEVEPLFEKIIYEYEKTENEPIIEFNEWKPKSLTHKGKLKVFWEEELNSTTRTKRDNYYFNSIPEGWQVWFDTRYEKAINPATGEELDLMNGGRYSRFHSTNPNISIGRVFKKNGFVCYNRETKEVLWRISNGLNCLLKGELYDDQAKININNGRIDWEIKKINDEYYRLQSEFRSENNLILLYSNSNDDPNIGLDIYSFDPVGNKIVKIATIPSSANIFHRKNRIYYFTNQKLIYSVNAETYKTEYVGDFSQYFDSSKVYIPSNEDPTLILSDHSGKGDVIYNLESKKTSPYFKKIYSIENDEFNINYYIIENGVYKGIDPETFEFTWTFDEKEIRKESIEFDILLIDSRGILVRVGDEKIVGLRP